MHSIVSVLRDLGIAAGALVAIVAHGKLPVISRPGKYVWRRLVAEPVEAWVQTFGRSLVAEALEPVYRRLDSIDGAVNTRPPGSPTMSQDVAETRHRVTKIEAHQLADHERLRAIEDVVTSPPKDPSD